jgi:hypothetical protein
MKMSNHLVNVIVCGKPDDQVNEVLADKPYRLIAIRRRESHIRIVLTKLPQRFRQIDEGSDVTAGRNVNVRHG